MAKEIHEQPEVVSHTLARYLDMGQRVRLPRRSALRLPHAFAGCQYRPAVPPIMRGCRKYWSSALPACRSRSTSLRVSLPRGAMVPGGSRSSYRNRGDRRHIGDAALSQGEKQHIVSVVNVPTSTIARASDAVIAHARGPRDRSGLHQSLHLPARVLACLRFAAGAARGVPVRSGREDARAALIEVRA